METEIASVFGRNEVSTRRKSGRQFLGRRSRRRTVSARAVIFVDTSAWFAASVPSDRNHGVADRWMRQNSERLLTTDYVIDELMTLLVRRGERARGSRAREACFGEGCAHLEHVSPDDFHRSWNLHDAFADKDWSFTDCTSRIVMERMGVTQALAFDEHFKQFGTVTVLPS